MPDGKSNVKLHPQLTLQFFTSEKCFGPGVAILLEKIKENNSISKACAQIGMSYSKAWTIIKRAETNLGFKLLESKTGGVDGGGATLTKSAQRLLSEFRMCEKELNDFCDVKFSEHFSWIDDNANKE